MHAICVVMTLTLAAPVPKDDLKELQGVWRVVQWGQNGNLYEIRDKTHFYVIKDNELSNYDSHSVGISRSRLEVRSGRLKVIRKAPDCPNLEREHPGIYSVEGDTLKICRIAAAKGTVNPANFELPKKFETYKDSNYILYILKRSSFDEMKGMELIRSDPVKGGIVKYRFGEEDKKPKDDD